MGHDEDDVSEERAMRRKIAMLGMMIVLALAGSAGAFADQIQPGVNNQGSGGAPAGSTGSSRDDARDAAENCTTILTGISCDGEGGEGIGELLNLALRILTAGVGILATIGLVVSGIQYVMARDDTGVVTRVKSRIFNIVIGLVAYGLMWIVLEWLIPGKIM